MSHGSTESLLSNKNYNGFSINAVCLNKILYVINNKDIIIELLKKKNQDCDKFNNNVACVLDYLKHCSKTEISNYCINASNISMEGTAQLNKNNGISSGNISREDAVRFELNKNNGIYTCIIHPTFCLDVSYPPTKDGFTRVYDAVEDLCYCYDTEHKNCNILHQNKKRNLFKNNSSSYARF